MMLPYKDTLKVPFRLEKDMLSKIVDAELLQSVVNFRRLSKSRDVSIYTEAALCLRRQMIRNDPHYPIYHFAPPESWMNDPNGVIRYNGQYHLFYQFDPVIETPGGYSRSKRCWGHAVSADLVHWKDWPVAIWPDSPYDKNGAYSGNAFICDDGTPAVMYTGNINELEESYGMLARSSDNMLTWEKKMVMAKPPYPGTPPHWDAQVWKDETVWYQLIGGTLDGQGAANLFTSNNLESWAFAETIFSGQPGSFWELPYLLPCENGSYVLMIGQVKNPYWIGTFDPKVLKFTPERKQPEFLDQGTYYSVNPSMIDEKGPGGAQRRILHGWVTGPESPTSAAPFWQGAHSIPRTMRLTKGQLVLEPIHEIEVLRNDGIHFANMQVTPGGQGYLGGVRGDALEILAEIRPGAGKLPVFSVKLRKSEDGKEYASVFYDFQTGDFGIRAEGDAPCATKENGTESLNAEAVWVCFAGVPEDNRPVSLRIFLDRSIVEAYVNGKALTGRIFMNHPGGGADISAKNGDIEVMSLSVWRMKSIWD